MKIIVLLSIISFVFSAVGITNQYITVSGSYNSGSKSCSLAITNSLAFNWATAASQLNFNMWLATSPNVGAPLDMSDWYILC